MLKEIGQIFMRATLANPQFVGELFSKAMPKTNNPIAGTLVNMGSQILTGWIMSKTQPKPEEIANKFRDKYEQVYQAKFAELKSQGKTEEEAESLASKEGIAAAASTLTEAEISILRQAAANGQGEIKQRAQNILDALSFLQSSTQPAPTSPQANLPVDPVQQKALEEAKAKQQASSTTAPVPTTGVDELKTKAALSAFETALKEKESGINPRQNFIEAWNAIGDHKNTIRAAAKAGTSPEAKLIMDTVAQLLPEEKTAAPSSSQITTPIVPDATKAPVATTSQASSLVGSNQTYSAPQLVAIYIPVLMPYSLYR